MQGKRMPLVLKQKPGFRQDDRLQPAPDPVQSRHTAGWTVYDAGRAAALEAMYSSSWKLQRPEQLIDLRQRPAADQRHRSAQRFAQAAQQHEHRVIDAHAIGG